MQGQQHDQFSLTSGLSHKEARTRTKFLWSFFSRPVIATLVLLAIVTLIPRPLANADGLKFVAQIYSSNPYSLSAYADLNDHDFSVRVRRYQIPLNLSSGLDLSLSVHSGGCDGQPMLNVGVIHLNFNSSQSQNGNNVYSGDFAHSGDTLVQLAYNVPRPSWLVIQDPQAPSPPAPSDNTVGCGSFNQQ